MSPETERDQWDAGAAGDPHVRDRLAALDGDLMHRMPTDARLESGIPEGQRAGALDFIQMTGLTRPPARTPSPGRLAPIDALAHPDLDPSAPLSFYEKGIADVDDSMDGGEVDLSLRDVNLDADLVPDLGTGRSGAGGSQSAKAFRDIIAELQSGSGGTFGADTGGAQAADGADGAPDEIESALRSLADELAAGAAPELSNEAADIDEAPVHAPEEPLEEPHLESPPDTSPAANDAGGDEEDFDALLAALSADSPQAPEAAPDAAHEADEPSEAWDAMLDAVAPDGRDVRAGDTGGGALARAEQLMHQLSVQPADHVAAPAQPAGEVGEVGDGAEASPTYGYDTVPSRRRSRKHSRLARRGWRLVKLGVILCVLAGAGGAFWWYVLAPIIQRPEDLAADAGNFMAANKFAEASSAYLQLARRPSADRADAQFRAAHALTRGQPAGTAGDTHQRYTRALEIFELFVKENPDHPKYTRALSVMGRLHYELANYDEAIAILRDRVNPVDDPAAALATLRYLARAYTKTGAYDQAETSYLQAATLPGNYSAETDYLELGDLFRTRAGLSEDPGERKALEETAVAYWNRGTQVSGINPAVLGTLHERLEWSEFTGDAGPPPATAEKPGPDIAPEPANMPESSALVVQALPAEDPAAGRVEDPARELEALILGGAAETSEEAPPAAPEPEPGTE